MIDTFVCSLLNKVNEQYISFPHSHSHFKKQHTGTTSFYILL